MVSSEESKVDAHAIDSMLEEYFPRQLSYGRDSLAAFEGVINAQFNNGSLGQEFPKHFYGIPLMYNNDPFTENSFTSSFIAGLAWCIGGFQFYRQRLPTSEGRAAQIPSWSWARPKTLYPIERGDLMLKFCIPHNWRLPDPIEVTVAHRVFGENKLDNIVASPSPTDYLDFLPHIDITTYVLVPKVSNGKPLAEFWYVDSRSDHWSPSFLVDGSLPEVEGEQLALWLGLYMQPRDGFADANEAYVETVTGIFLVCQENADKETYSRVGLWFVPGFFYAEGHPLGFVEVLEKISQHLKPDFGIQHLARRTIRLV
ncbi:hypothetical protein BKA63DRAFT_80481 [Paraphoma chrysanthemicola]|nr:hypothetical protein BKA63DRAFT_80481 [Paraphoma chrysanthemicola]